MGVGWRAKYDQDFRVRGRRGEQAGPPEKELGVYLKKSEQPGERLISMPFFKASSFALFGEQGCLANPQGKEGPGSLPGLSSPPGFLFSYLLLPSLGLLLWRQGGLWMTPGHQAKAGLRCGT